MLPHDATQELRVALSPEQRNAEPIRGPSGWLWRNQYSEVGSLLGRRGEFGLQRKKFLGVVDGGGALHPPEDSGGGTGPVGPACRDLARVETGPYGIHWTGTTKRLLNRHLAELGESWS